MSTSLFAKSAQTSPRRRQSQKPCIDGSDKDPAPASLAACVSVSRCTPRFKISPPCATSGLGIERPLRRPFRVSAIPAQRNVPYRVLSTREHVCRGRTPTPLADKVAGSISPGTCARNVLRIKLCQSRVLGASPRGHWRSSRPRQGIETPNSSKVALTMIASVRLDMLSTSPSAVVDTGFQAQMLLSCTETSAIPPIARKGPALACGRLC